MSIARLMKDLPKLPIQPNFASIRWFFRFVWTIRVVVTPPQRATQAYSTSPDIFLSAKI